MEPSANQASTQASTHPISQINQSIIQSINQINPSINQSIDQSIHQSIYKEIPENTYGGIIVIGDYDKNILVNNKICTISNTLSHVVLLQLKYFNHNVCMIGKK